MTPREVLALSPLVVLVFWIGLYPKFFLDRLAPAVDPIGEEVTTHALRGIRTATADAPCKARESLAAIQPTEGAQ